MSRKIWTYKTSIKVAKYCKEREELKRKYEGAYDFLYINHKKELDKLLPLLGTISLLRYTFSLLLVRKLIGYIKRNQCYHCKLYIHTNLEFYNKYYDYYLYDYYLCYACSDLKEYANDPDYHEIIITEYPKDKKTQNKI